MPCYSWQDPQASCLGFPCLLPETARLQSHTPSLSSANHRRKCLEATFLLSGGVTFLFFRGLLLRLFHHPLLFHPEYSYSWLPSIVLGCADFIWLTMRDEALVPKQLSSKSVPNQQHQPHLGTCTKCSVSGPIQSY